MLVKRSSKNQVAIPKAIIERAGLTPDDAFFDVKYSDGKIVLTPVTVEERIPPEALARFEARNRRRGTGDRAFRSVDEMLVHLHRKRAGK